MIKTGGEWIAELEDLISRQPAVREVAVASVLLIRNGVSGRSPCWFCAKGRS